MKYILFCGGGSAGHVVPNLALMSELKYSCKIAYMGTGSIEKKLVCSTGYDFFQVECPKLVRSLCWSNFKIPFELSKANKKALEILQAEKPDLIFSKGGFASYPAVWAGHKLGIPILTHESDLSPGLCTKLVAKKCKYVLSSFAETAQLFSNGKCVSSPMRKELFRGDKLRAYHKYGFHNNKPVLLVLGGGSGSKALNDGVRERLNELLKEFQILHLCGSGNSTPIKRVGYVQREYESDMGSVYAVCDLVMSRAGSNTVFEILALKKKALFVPLEKCSRGDQLQNALYFEKKNLCRILHETQLDTLPQALKNLQNDKEVELNLLNCDVKNGTPTILELIKNTV